MGEAGRISIEWLVLIVHTLSPNGSEYSEPQLNSESHFRQQTFTLCRIVFIGNLQKCDHSATHSMYVRRIAYTLSTWYVFMYLLTDIHTYISVRVSVCVSVHVSVCLSVHVSVCLSVHVSICMSVHMSVRVSVRMSVRMSVRVSVCASVCMT